MDMKSQLLGSAAGMQSRNVQLDAPRQMPAPQGPPVKVMLAMPSGRTWEARTATAIAGLATFTALHGKQVGITNLEGSMISKQRNDLVEMALKLGMDYIQWIDTDMVMPPDSLLKLMAHNKDIVGATYNKRVPPYETLGELSGEKIPMHEMVKGGLREAKKLPGGFMLVKTDVYRKIGWPYYWETYEWPGENGVDALKAFLRHNFEADPPRELLDTLDAMPIAEWLNKIHADFPKAWQYWSEDLNFCRKVRKAGYRLWCDISMTFQMVHLGTLEVTCKPPQDGPDSPVIAAQM